MEICAKSKGKAVNFLTNERKVGLLWGELPFSARADGEIFPYPLLPHQ
ncbi:hypothetical protein RUMCAL_02250 [Ruminococcus callidus ATCC 27760]|uniref:Uncharacterized protein n=1 Tax=Ruminococcus callidus ATCC 27760 TaxID=411473 RepID=U2KMV7_9FIRM|nr:hypothetical protein RUMCAL_02250 [Ruminococcus callidus ATCC 27760]